MWLIVNPRGRYVSGWKRNRLNGIHLTSVTDADDALHFKSKAEAVEYIHTHTKYTSWNDYRCTEGQHEK